MQSGLTTQCLYAKWGADRRGGLLPAFEHYGGGLGLGLRNRTSVHLSPHFTLHINIEMLAQYAHTQQIKWQNTGGDGARWGQRVI